MFAIGTPTNIMKLGQLVGEWVKIRKKMGRDGPVLTSAIKMNGHGWIQ